MEKYYTFRVDYIDDQTTDKVTNFVDEILVFKALISHEISDKVKKPHYQGFFSVIDTDYQTVQNLFRKYFSKYLALQKSCKAMRKNEYKSYILKQQDVRFRKNISDEEFESIPQWVEQTKQEKKVSHREKFYSEFLEFCKSSNRFDESKHNLRWIAGQFIDFLGKQPLPELVPWMKGVVFSAASVFAVDSDNKKIRDELIDRILS